jgi:hypothetical protein
METNKWIHTCVCACVFTCVLEVDLEEKGLSGNKDGDKLWLPGKQRNS